MSTGEGAEEMEEDFPVIGKAIIHEHEEMAEKLALVLYALAITSLFGLYSNLKNKPKANLVSYIATVVAIIAVFFSQQTGTTGGEVRHTEIRTNSASADSKTEKITPTNEAEKD
ncbi:hypothetical protein [Flavobacterium glaciei]|uniref:Uncharacterized protein n=1 Tax=Flavobacterium glaciei TaxID=386300 RepID=A0A562PPK5_9FLAO|nr:hypothetical protein [Flavobacterium glaciei]RDI53493.1 hypothetical protein DFR66_10956 [Flavobacterium glaciei]TWI46395.1 hypothetical protein IQ02_01917 [Flavobacterium glaciei]